MTVRVWNSYSGKLINELQGHSHWVTSVAISHDGTTIVSGSSDMTVRVWNAQNGTCIKTLEFYTEINHINFSINETHIIVNNAKAFSLSTFTVIDPFAKSDDLDINLVIGNWIILAGLKLFWLPSSFRPYSSHTVLINNHKVIIGTSSGRVLIISLNTDNDEQLVKGNK
ncbi:WD40-repeat-containing domain protein [Cyathus striatus]|nr:WD40-repeat-containing domain protein [Cyathus striatus]